MGKKVCSMLINYSEVFTSECIQEIYRRHYVNNFYGPPKAYGIAMCEIETLMLGSSIEMSRQNASILVAVLDWLVMFVVAVSIIRLKWYENASIQDMKSGKLRIEDFAVFLP